MICALALALTCCPGRLEARRPFGALDRDQSAYALGSFALSVVFVESNGVHDANLEDWTEAQLTTIHGQVDQAVAFWEGLTSSYHPNAQLDITVDYANEGIPVETKYEPITRGGLNGSFVWINDVMGTLGHSGTDARVNTRDFNNAQRDALDTHWAATVYVVNDAADSDHKFTDGHFAFSYHGGPYIVTTYNNNGWGPDRYHRILSHELGHIFFALDEYYGGGERNTNRSGYLNGVNGNSERDENNARITPPYPDALMLNTVLDPSPFTSVQIGHLDTDNDSIPDILDTVPYIVEMQLDSDPDAGVFAFSGTGHVNPANNNNPKTWAESGARMTINTIEMAWYNLDDQGWTQFPAGGEAYGDYIELIDLELTGLAPGLHTIDIRITNSVGNHSAIKSYELYVVPEPCMTGVLCVGMLACLRRGRKRRLT